MPQTGATRVLPPGPTAVIPRNDYDGATVRYPTAEPARVGAAAGSTAMMPGPGGPDEDGEKSGFTTGQKVMAGLGAGAVLLGGLAAWVLLSGKAPDSTVSPVKSTTSVVAPPPPTTVWTTTEEPTTTTQPAPPPVVTTTPEPTTTTTPPPTTTTTAPPPTTTTRERPTRTTRPTTRPSYPSLDLPLPGAGDSLPGVGGTHEADSSRYPETSSQGMP